MFTKLNLPKPSEQLSKIVLDIANSQPINHSMIDWHNKQQTSEFNIVSGDFVYRPDLGERFMLEYSSVNIPMSPLVGILRNTKDPSNLACYPIHCDRVRTIAINYYIDLGGSNVETSFYNEYNDPSDIVGGYVLPYSKHKPISKYQTDKDTWYFFNTKQYHSVENIETTRIILSCTMNVKYLDQLQKFVIE
jgi:hypothetical protein